MIAYHYLCQAQAYAFWSILPFVSSFLLSVHMDLLGHTLNSPNSTVNSAEGAAGPQSRQNLDQDYAMAVASAASKPEDAKKQSEENAPSKQ